MSIVKYKMLIKTAEIGSITKAAKLLGYTQSALSRCISSLEDEWGFTIFFRSKYNVKLTPNGEKLIYTMRQIVNLNEALLQTVSEINGLRSGLVRIGSFESVAIGWIPKIIKRFYEDYPLIDFEIVQGDYSDIVSWLNDDIIDCGFSVAPLTDRYDFTPLIGDPFRAVLPLDNPMCDLDTFPLSRLSEFPFIVPGEGLQYDIGRMLNNVSVKPNVRLTAENDFVTLSLIENGLGISILPALVLENHGKKVCVKELDFPCSRIIGIAVKSLKQAQPATKLFVEYTKSFVSIMNDIRF